MDKLQLDRYNEFIGILNKTMENHTKMLKIARDLYSDFACQKMFDEDENNYMYMREILVKVLFSSSELLSITELENKIK